MVFHKKNCFEDHDHLIFGCRSEVLPGEPLPSSITARLPSLEELDVFAIEQWEVHNEILFRCCHICRILSLFLFAMLTVWYLVMVNKFIQLPIVAFRELGLSFSLTCCPV